MNIMLLLCYVYEALFSWCTSVSKACFVFYWLWAGSFSQRIKISNPIGVTGLLFLCFRHFTPCRGKNNHYFDTNLYRLNYGANLFTVCILTLPRNFVFILNMKLTSYGPANLFAITVNWDLFILKQPDILP